MANRNDTRLVVFGSTRVEVRPIPEVSAVHVEAWPAASRLRRPGSGAAVFTCTPNVARELGRRLMIAANEIEGIVPEIGPRSLEVDMDGQLAPKPGTVT